MDGGAAFAGAEQLLATMRSVEKLGLQTAFPHPSDLYEILAGKTWTYTLPLQQDLHVPACVRLPRNYLARPREAANAALTALGKILEAKGQPKSAHGVAKLPFSWEALDVKHFDGYDELLKALNLLHVGEYINGKLAGQCHRAHMLIQEYVAHDLELRCYVVEGQVEEFHYTRFERVDAYHAFKEFTEVNRDECLERWMNGDSAMLVDAEQRARQLVQSWLVWLQAQTCAPIPAVRFDFFIRLGEPGSVKVKIWTNEICEVGFSMFNSKHLPNKVFRALAKSALGAPPTPGFPTGRSDLVCKGAHVLRGEGNEMEED